MIYNHMYMNIHNHIYAYGYCYISPPLPPLKLTFMLRSMAPKFW